MYIRTLQKKFEVSKVLLNITLTLTYVYTHTLIILKYLSTGSESNCGIKETHKTKEQNYPFGIILPQNFYSSSSIQ